MPPQFSLHEEHLDDQRHVIAVAGEIDLFTAPELKSALAGAVESGRTRIVVDLTETSFLDSTALGVLIGAVKRLRTRDGVLTIVNTDRNIAKTFEITGPWIAVASAPSPPAATSRASIASPSSKRSNTRGSM